MFYLVSFKAKGFFVSYILWIQKANIRFLNVPQIAIDLSQALKYLVGGDGESFI